MLRAACQLDELWQDTAPGDIQRQIDPRGRQGADQVNQALAVSDRLSPEGTHVVVVGGAGRADHASTTRHRQLHRGTALIARGAVDQHGAAEPTEFCVHELDNLHMACNLRHRPHA